MVIPFVYFDPLMVLRNPDAVWVPEAFRERVKPIPEGSSLLNTKVRIAAANEGLPRLLAEVRLTCQLRSWSSRLAMMTLTSSSDLCDCSPRS